MREKRARRIDYVMEEMGFKRLRTHDSPKNYNKMYVAIDNDIRVANVTTSCYRITYEVTFYMLEDEWNFKFDKIGFEQKLRTDLHVGCKFQSANYYVQGVMAIRYYITITDKRG